MHVWTKTSLWSNGRRSHRRTVPVTCQLPGDLCLLREDTNVLWCEPCWHPAVEDGDVFSRKHPQCPLNITSVPAVSEISPRRWDCPRSNDDSTRNVRWLHLFCFAVRASFLCFRPLWPFLTGPFQPNRSCRKWDWLNPVLLPKIKQQTGLKKLKWFIVIPEMLARG